MKTYKTIFFDLDHTLWDFEKNSLEALSEIFYAHKLQQYGVELNTFIAKYKSVNQHYWILYRNNKINKEELRTGRFIDTLTALNINPSGIAGNLADDYIRLSPVKTNLLPGSLEILNYLKNKAYKLAIITNGFDEVQYTKLKSCNLHHFFDTVITSEKAGVRKPHKKIFHYALKQTQSKNMECIMIGDDIESDMLGSKKLNIDQVFFNPQQIKHSHKFTYEIKLLEEVKKFL